MKDVRMNIPNNLRHDLGFMKTTDCGSIIEFGTGHNNLKDLKGGEHFTYLNFSALLTRASRIDVGRMKHWEDRR